jgi:hypothetical protein
MDVPTPPERRRPLLLNSDLLLARWAPSAAARRASWSSDAPHDPAAYERRHRKRSAAGTMCRRPPPRGSCGSSSSRGCPPGRRRGTRTRSTRARRPREHRSWPRAPCEPTRHGHWRTGTSGGQEEEAPMDDAGRKAFVCVGRCRRCSDPSPIFGLPLDTWHPLPLIKQLQINMKNGQVDQAPTNKCSVSQQNKSDLSKDLTKSSFTPEHSKAVCKHQR